MFIENFRNANWESIAAMPHDAPPQWGSMTLQHMVEHLIDVFRICNGTLQVEISTPEDKIEKIKRIALLSDREFQQNFKSPILPPEPIPYRENSLQTAIKTLKNEIEKFELHFAANSRRVENHPVFGALNYNEWELYHNKHFTHHFKQFNLL